jgi:hypothetical protein
LDFASTVRIDEEIFLLAAEEFYRRAELDDSDKQMFLQTFSNQNNQSPHSDAPLFAKLQLLCSVAKP